MTDGVVRTELSDTYKLLAEQHLIFLAAGNISVRHKDGMLISATGVSASSVRPDFFVQTGFDGSCESDLWPSSEWRMHAAIYRAFPQANAVVHTHSDYCVAVSATGMALPPFHYMVASFGGKDVRCTDYVVHGSQELALEAVRAMEGRTACLLGNHGMICQGRSLRMAADAALRLETLCRQYVLARQAGTIRMMSEEDMARTAARYASYQAS